MRDVWVWALDRFAETVELATPAIARQVSEMCTGKSLDTRQARRVVLSVFKYLLRMTGRATPFGLFAGITAGSFGPDLAFRWSSDHRALARPNAFLLADVSRAVLGALWDRGFRAALGCRGP
jgi:hypothetical protein